MLVAIITVIGSVVVALIGFAGVRGPVEGRHRARLLKDAELLSRLDADSLAGKLLSSDIDRRVGELVVGRRTKGVWLQVAIGVAWLAVALGLYIWTVTPAQFLVSIKGAAPYLKGAAPFVAILYLASGIFSLASAGWLLRKRDKLLDRLD